MTFHRAIFWAGLVAALASGEAAAQTPFAGPQAALETNTLQRGNLNSLTPDPAQGGVAPAALDPAPGRARPPETLAPGPRGNPLWTIPLKSLSVTRERPIFTPSRRPPAPAVAGPPPVEPVRPPPPPAEPDRPRLAVIGAVGSETAGIAVFVEETTRDIVRLKVGEGHTGWILRSVKGREVLLQKEGETVTLAMPAPSDQQSSPGRSPTVGGGGTLPGLSRPSPSAAPGGPPPRLAPAVPPPSTGRLPGL